MMCSTGTPRTTSAPHVSSATFGVFQTQTSAYSRHIHGTRGCASPCSVSRREGGASHPARPCGGTRWRPRAIPRATSPGETGVVPQPRDRPDVNDASHAMRLWEGDKGLNGLCGVPNGEDRKARLHPYGAFLRAGHISRATSTKKIGRPRPLPPCPFDTTSAELRSTILRADDPATTRQ